MQVALHILHANYSPSVDYIFKTYVAQNVYVSKMHVWSQFVHTCHIHERQFNYIISNIKLR